MTSYALPNAWELVVRFGMVSTTHWLASRAGTRALELGDPKAMGREPTRSRIRTRAQGGTLHPAPTHPLDELRQLYPLLQTAV